MRRDVVAIGVLFFLLSGAAAEAVPRTVSPGDSQGIATVTAPCPTFSWAGSTPAAGYELKVFGVSPDGLEVARSPDLTVSLPGTASSWTPSADHCLEQGKIYAWAVGEIGVEGVSWSIPSLFQVAPDTLATEIVAALATALAELHHTAPGAMMSSPPVRRPDVRASPAASGKSSGDRAGLSEPSNAVVDLRSAQIYAERPEGIYGAAIVGEAPASTLGSGVYWGVRGECTGGIWECIGVVGNNPVGQGVIGTGALGVYGESFSGGGSAGVFINEYGGDLIVGSSQRLTWFPGPTPTPEFRVDSQGDVTAREIYVSDVFADTVTSPQIGGTFHGSAEFLSNLPLAVIQRISNADAVTSLSRNCEAEETIVGGGCSCSVGTLTASKPIITGLDLRHGWSCSCSASATIQVKAICMDIP